jgi:hypothetical protein
LPTTNPTCPDPGSNQGRGGKPATNRLSSATAHQKCCSWSQWQRGLRHEMSSPLSNSWILGSSPTQDMDVCVRLFCVCDILGVGRGPATGWSPVQGVLPTMYRLRNWKAAKAQQRAIEP